MPQFILDSKKKSLLCCSSISTLYWVVSYWDGLRRCLLLHTGAWLSCHRDLGVSINTYPQSREGSIPTRRWHSVLSVFKEGRGLESPAAYLRSNGGQWSEWVFRVAVLGFQSLQPTGSPVHSGRAHTHCPTVLSFSLPCLLFIFFLELMGTLHSLFTWLLSFSSILLEWGQLLEGRYLSTLFTTLSPAPRTGPDIQ